MFKKSGSPYYFLISHLISHFLILFSNIEQTRLFLFKFLASFFMASLAHKLIYTINIWFNFVFGSFFEQDRLLNLIILGVYAKRWPKYACFSKQKLM